MNHCRPPDLKNVLRRSRHLPVTLAICAGVGFAMVVSLVVRWWESREIESAFRMAAEDRAAAVKRTFETHMAMLELVRAACASRPVERRDFQELLQPFLVHSSSIQAVEWVPRVSKEDRFELEAAGQRDGIEGFQVTEKDGQGAIVRAAPRDEHFPILFSGPQPGDRGVVGFDLASEPTRLRTLIQARDSGRITASGWISFIQDKEPDGGFSVVLPVYEPRRPVEKLEDRRRHLRGFVLGVFRPREMIESALARLQPEGIDVCLYDPPSAEGGQSVYIHASRRPGDARQTRETVSRETGKVPATVPITNGTQGRVADHSVRLDVAGHPWSIVCSPSPGFVTARRTWWSWGVLAAGMAFTAILAGYLRANIDRQANIEQLLAAKREYARTLEEKVRSQTLHIRRAQEEVTYRLVSASLWRDEETGMHIRRTGLLSEALARAAGWPDTEAEILRQAAPMHDVGKIGIPDAVLRKPGKLDAYDFEVMKTHATIGAEMLSGSDVPVLQLAREIALNHHERWDGQGYPAGRAGSEIPECARIVSIVDVYDALTHDRVYRCRCPRRRQWRSCGRGRDRGSIRACWRSSSRATWRSDALRRNIRTSPGQAK